MDVEDHIPIATDGHIVDSRNGSLTFPMLRCRHSIEWKVDPSSCRGVGKDFHAKVGFDGAEQLQIGHGAPFRCCTAP
jgi:hypothetical protein